MRRLILFSLLLLVAANVFAHAGEVHKHMGTVAALDRDGSFTLKKTDGATLHIAVSKATAFRYTDGSTAPRTALTTGKRAVVTISTDGKTASEVKFGR